MVAEWLDLAAVVVGALAGVLVSREHNLDLVGFVGMCLICALGGGILRDVIMQVGTAHVYCLSSHWPIVLCVIIGVVGFLFPSAVLRHATLREWVDIISVALFVVAGSEKAIEYELYAEGVVLMGTITGVGGGMLRDVFLGEVPKVFMQSNLYALCAVTGAITYWVCAWCAGDDRMIGTVATVLVVVLLRRISLRFGVMSPAEVDLTPKVADATKRVAREIQTHARRHEEL